MNHEERTQFEDSLEKTMAIFARHISSSFPDQRRSVNITLWQGVPENDKDPYFPAIIIEAAYGNRKNTYVPFLNETILADHFSDPSKILPDFPDGYWTDPDRKIWSDEELFVSCSADDVVTQSEIDRMDELFGRPVSLGKKLSQQAAAGRFSDILPLQFKNDAEKIAHKRALAGS